MKRVLLITLGVSILIGCGSSNKGADPETKTPKRDTSLTLAMYLGYGLKGVEYGPARKIVVDSLTWVDRDSSTKKKEWTKITLYDVEVNIPVKDSTTAKIFGITNTDTVVRRILRADERYVRDGVTNWDSTLKYLKQFIDTTKTK